MRELTVFIGYKCNLICDYCFVYDNVEKDKFTDNFDFDKFQDLIKEGLQYPDTVIEYLGGEPFAMMDRLKECVNKAKEVGYDRPSILYTNGTIMDDNIIEYCNSENIQIFFSIDGNKYSHNLSRRFKSFKGSFDVAWNNYLTFRDKFKYDPVVQFTVSDKNYSSFKDSILFFIANGVKRINLGFTFELKDDFNMICSIGDKLVELHKENKIPDDVIVYPIHGVVDKITIAKGENGNFYCKNYYLITKEELENYVKDGTMTPMQLNFQLFCEKYNHIYYNEIKGNYRDLLCEDFSRYRKD